MIEAIHRVSDRMQQNAIDVLDDIITDLWADWVFDSGDSTVRDRARYLDKLRAKCKGEEFSFELGRLLGAQWALSCPTKIKMSDAVETIEQIQEELPPLFKEIESRLEGYELEVFRQGFSCGVRDYQDGQ